MSMLLCSLIRVRKSIWDDTTIIFAWEKESDEKEKNLPPYLFNKMRYLTFDAKKNIDSYIKM